MSKVDFRVAAVCLDVCKSATEHQKMEKKNKTFTAVALVIPRAEKLG